MIEIKIGLIDIVKENLITKNLITEKLDAQFEMRK